MNKSETTLMQNTTLFRKSRRNNMNETYSTSTTSKSNFNRTLTLFPAKHDASVRSVRLEPEKFSKKIIRSGEHVIPTDTEPSQILLSRGQIHSFALCNDLENLSLADQSNLQEESKPNEDKILQDIAKFKGKIADTYNAKEKIKAKIKIEKQKPEEDTFSEEIKQYKETLNDRTVKQQALITEHKSLQDEEDITLTGCLIRNVFKIDVNNLYCQDGKPCVPLPDVPTTDECYIFNCPTLRINTKKT